ncbi:MAG: S41 family peptidase [Clostridia bacterium]|nr:S41 family peptidase [Clostridia bacterium]
MEEENNRGHKIYKIVMLIVVTVFVTFIATSIGFYQYFIHSDGNYIVIESSKNSSKVVKELEKIMSIIDKYYLGEINEDDVIEGTIQGYIYGVGDKYTEYISKEDMEDYKNQIMGNYVGIGIYMIQNEEKNLIQVLSPIKESPAEKEGILPGDLITKIDGVEYSADQMTVASNKIKGEAGTKVKLELLRGDKTIEVELTRSEIHMNPITANVLEQDNKIGYMEVSSFDEGTGKDFKTKFEQLKSQNIESLIIDLRNNGGGLVSEALEIADYIVDKGNTLLITVDKNDKEDVEKAKTKPIIDMPIIILVNENTASASEILAGALKDHNKATIVGTKTYGKGVIQQLMTLPDGSGLKVTIEEYFTPNKNKINGVGIKPDEEIQLPETVENILLVQKEEDTQLQKAIEVLQNKE